MDAVLRALAHPVRLKMMTLMWPGPLSAAELARELGISHALASQHLRRLDAAGLVELAEERRHRGGQERRYRAVRGTPLSDQRDGLPLLVETLVHMLRERAARRDPDRAGVTVDAELWVAPADWERFRTQLAALAAQLHEVAQPTRTEGTMPVAVSVMAFPLVR
jgi:DNA-binding transcriptional ArsR family regulator